MQIKSVTVALAAALLAIPVSGCGTGQMVQTAYGPMPDYCMGNNAAQGAAILGLIGAVAGAAAGGGRGAAIGGLSGAALGGLAGAQVDAQCRQLAAQRAMEMALAQNEALLAEQARRHRYASLSVNSQVEYVSQAGHRQSVRMTQLNAYADPATKQVCATGSGTEADLDGKTNTAIAPPKMCKGPDGKWTPA